MLFDLAPQTATVALVAGLSTSVGASILGFFQEDGKKLLACSTASQLGYVIIALGLRLYGEALYLLAFCCCNKAVTFIWFGAFMRRHSGVSDFRLVSGQPLTWVEHAGLATAVANFTVFPGAFCWHVKGLFGQSVLPAVGFFAEAGLGLMQITWFLSSLYLFSLYFTLFFGPHRRSVTHQSVSHGSLATHQNEQLRAQPTLTYAASVSSLLRAALWVGQWALVWYCGACGLFFFETLWLESGTAALLTYY